MKAPLFPLSPETGKPERSQLPYTLIFPVYLLLFFITERLITDQYWVSYLPLDDKIPFCEWFVIPYVLWYPFLIVTGFFLMFRDPVGYKRYMLFIAVGFYGACLVYVLFPNGQNLRPDPLPRENFLTAIIGWLYAHDTNTNVLPSIHVIGSMGACFALRNTPALRHHWIRPAAAVFAAAVTASTVFIKQHSVLDILAAIPFSVLTYWIVYHLGWPRLRAQARQQAASRNR